MKKLIVFLILIPSIANAEFAKFYFSVDSEQTKKQTTVFNDACQNFYVEYVLINTRITKRFYMACIDEKANLDSFILAIASLNPEMLGAFKFNGLQLGRTKQLKTPAVTDKDGKITTPATYQTIGVSKHPFQKTKYISLMRNKKTFDGDGNVLTSTRPVKEKETHNFAGWAKAEIITGVSIEAEK